MRSRYLKWFTASLLVATLCNTGFIRSARGSSGVIEEKSGENSSLAFTNLNIPKPSINPLHSVHFTEKQTIAPEIDQVPEVFIPPYHIKKVVESGPSLSDHSLPIEELARAPQDYRMASTEEFVTHCTTPRSLMLHGYYGAERMESLAKGIIARGVKTLTYRDILESFQRGECPSRDSIVVSLDDIYSSGINSEFKDMIAAFTERGLVLVIGVIVRGPQDPEAWAYLRNLEELGLEVASHTKDHPNLPELTRAEIEEQISGSYHLMCENLHKCPVSFIVPFGSIDLNDRILNASHEYSFVVGIARGLTIDGEPPYYVGRASPNIHSVDLTFQVLDVTFGY
ncbi:MAG: polysaccharide deacetylase family protein [Anaerolineales bacterium]|nr:polysaccharide deacetylase family protein [Anaerolineales bacterium]